MGESATEDSDASAGAAVHPLAVRASSAAVVAAGRRAPAARIMRPHREPSFASRLADTPSADEPTEAARQLLVADRFDAARSAFAEVVKKKPANAEAWVGLALARAELGQRKGAGEALHRALVLQPKNGPALVLSGFLSQQRKDFPQAREMYARYLEAEPQGEFAEELKSVLAQLP